jgi:amino acid adenylation domain-containing protein
MRSWNSTAVDFPDVCLHELFEARVGVDPDAVALVWDGGELSYAQLDRWATSVANALRASGVGPEVPVGVLVDRSAEMVVGVLAVLKAGGAFVPLDVESPTERLTRIVEDAGIHVCVTVTDSRSPVPGNTSAVCVDSPHPATGEAPEPQTRKSRNVRPHNAVCVYYTSGSTGTPKGVVNVHAGWVNRINRLQREHQLQAGETVLHKTTLTFDDAGLELFWPLAFGGRIALLAPGAHRDPRAIIEAAAAFRSISLQLVPSMLTAVLEELDETKDVSRLDRLRIVVSSGEALRPETVRRFRRMLTAVRLSNTWGATEVSIDSTSHTCGPEDETGSQAVSLGLPFDNNEVHVLDPDGHPVPVGVKGELCIGGIGLARGYLGDPARTAAAFVPHPIHPGQRLYRTGDQGWQRTDGTLVFAGRTDQQVKIRGMRVELGEIETVISTHPHITNTAVTIWDEGIPRLVAYVAPTPAECGPWDELRRAVRAHAAERLPSHMVPSLVVVLDALPLNRNGKVDRARLPEPDTGRDNAGVAFTPPSGPVQIRLAAIWSALLGQSEISADDGFLALGGHSLLAMQLAHRIHSEFGVDIGIRGVFSAPTLADQAELVTGELTARMNELDIDQLSALLDSSTTTVTDRGENP